MLPFHDQDMDSEILRDTDDKTIRRNRCSNVWPIKSYVLQMPHYFTLFRPIQLHIFKWH